MKSVFGNISLSIICGYILVQFQLFFETQYLTKFLKDNLIMLLVTLIAINSATLSIVLTKVKELLDKSGKVNAFMGTKEQMILSINEQICIIILSILLLIIQDSSIIKSYPNIITFLDVILVGSFIYAIRILHDTSKSVFVVLDY